MRGRWYVALLVGLFLITVNILISCVPSTILPASQPSEVGVQPSTSLPHESVAADTPAHLELYYCGEPFSEDCFITLNTITSLSGNGSRTEYITMNQSPWIVNYYWSQTSNIGCECSVDIWQGRVGPHDWAYGAGGLGFPNHASKTLEDVYCVKVYKTGDFTIEVKCSGCRWWVKIGIEPNKEVANPDQKMITGKWQHGISDCPPHMAKKLCEEFKKLPEGKLYYLEFFDDGHVDRIATGWDMMGGFTRFGGRYSLIGSKLEINWDLEGYETYEIKKLSENEMVLQNEVGSEQTFHRVN